MCLSLSVRGPPETGMEAEESLMFVHGTGDLHVGSSPKMAYWIAMLDGYMTIVDYEVKGVFEDMGLQ